MKTCRTCSTPNTDDANLCVGCGAPLTELAAEYEVQRMLQLQEAKKKRRRVLTALGAAAAIALVGFLLWQGAKEKEQQEAVRKFYLSVREAYDSNVVEFWKCVTRGARMPDNNLQLAEAVETAFRKAPKGYVKHVRDRCLPMALKAPQEMRNIKAPEAIAGKMDAYATSLEGVAKAAQGFADDLGKMAEDAELDAKVLALAGNYHAAPQDSTDTYAYDNFLRCAIPGYDDMNELQQVLEFLFTVLKEPAGHVARWRKECSPPLMDTSKATMHPKYRSKLEKFSPDSRDVQAFTDTFKKADEAKRKSLIEPLERAWFDAAKSWEELKTGFKEIIGEAKD